MSTTIDQLIERGFASISGILSAEQITVLQRESEALFQLEAFPFSQYLAKPREAADWKVVHYANPVWDVVRDILGTSPPLDAILEHVFSHPAVQSTLLGALGPGYKLWQCGVRKCRPKGGGQNLHQDAQGEFGVSILVTDTPRHDGATAFLPGSHRWPVAYSDLGFTIRPNLVAPLLGSAHGRAGDIFFFFNRTWHGRFDGVCPAVALQSSFVPVGTTYPIHRAAPDLLRRLGPELRNLLDPEAGVVDLGNGQVVVGARGQEPAVSASLRGVLTGQIPVANLSPFHAVKAWARMKNAVRDLVRR